MRRGFLFIVGLPALLSHREDLISKNTALLRADIPVLWLKFLKHKSECKHFREMASSTLIHSLGILALWLYLSKIGRDFI